MEIVSNANSAANAVVGDAYSMNSVPEIEGDPLAVRKLAVAVFHLADGLKAAHAEIEYLRSRLG